jgi:hypothetical protein
VRGVDGAYPLYGDVVLDPAMPLAEALAMDDLPGIVMQRLLVDRLALDVGDTVRLGTQDFELRAVLEVEPDGAAGGFSLGPRSIVRLDALAQSGLLEPGTLFDTQYRLALPDNANLATFEEEAETLFADSGMRWRDARNGAPGVQEFVDRIGAFLVLVGLAGLAVGGIGVSSAVRAYLDGKIATIATLKTLGAEARTIFTVYFAQIGLLTLVGIGIGVVLGALLPLALAPIIEARLPVPIAVSVYPAPLAEAALYGLLTALIFTLWPLARTEQVRAAALFRDAAGPSRALPRKRLLVDHHTPHGCAHRTGRDTLRHPAARTGNSGRYLRLAPAAGPVGAWHPRALPASRAQPLGPGAHSAAHRARSGRRAGVGRDIGRPVPRPRPRRAGLGRARSTPTCAPRSSGTCRRSRPPTSSSTSSPTSWSRSSTASKTTPPSAGSTPRRCCAASSPASTASARRTSRAITG